MKSHRFFSVFFALILVLTSLAPTALAAEEDAAAVEPPVIEAKAALLMDPNTDEILFEQNIHERLYPASLTKVMTALLTFEAIDRGEITLDTVFTASEEVIARLPSDGSNAGIKAGESFTVDQLLHCILVVSANEACDILAEGLAGSVDAFVERMNKRAAELGCKDTHFANTNGLHDTEHYTSAWDLYLIGREARKNDTFMRICGSTYVELPATEQSKARKFYTTNYLISTARSDRYLYRGATGMKTGSTNAAGYCLMATATRDDRDLFSVVLGAERITLEDGSKETKSFSETVKLLNWGFDSFTRETILSPDELLAEVPVTLSQQQNAVKLHPAEEILCLVPKGVDPEKDIHREIVFKQESVEAPVKRGQVLGQITLSMGDKVYGTVDLLADEDVAASRLLVAKRDFLLFLQRTEVKWTLIGVAALVVIIVILRLMVNSRRRRYGRGYQGSKSGGYRGRRR